MNILISIVNKFTEVSPAYQVRKWNHLAKVHGFHFVTFIGQGALTDLTPYMNEMDSTTFIKMDDHPDDLRDLFLPTTHTLQAEIDAIVDKLKPAKITCNMDFILFKYIEKYQCKKQIFVRQFFNKIHQVIGSHPRLSLNIEELDKSASASIEEARCLRLADLIITNNQLTYANINTILGLDAKVIVQYRDPAPFLNKNDLPDFNLKQYYHIGRTDHIKNVSALRPNRYELLLIGSNLISSELQELPNTIRINDFNTIDKWYPLVKNVPISVNPCIYETNGFAVQEALMMGKIVVVQENSGGNLLNIVHGENGLVVDFETDDYESILENLSTTELVKLSSNAKQTIDTSIYAKSLQEYLNEIL